jgi:hypothetical protein
LLQTIITGRSDLVVGVFEVSESIWLFVCAAAQVPAPQTPNSSTSPPSITVEAFGRTVLASLIYKW